MGYNILTSFHFQLTILTGDIVSSYASMVLQVFNILKKKKKKL